MSNIENLNFVFLHFYKYYKYEQKVKITVEVEGSAKYEFECTSESKKKEIIVIEACNQSLEQLFKERETITNLEDRALSILKKKRLLLLKNNLFRRQVRPDDTASWDKESATSEVLKCHFRGAKVPL